MADDDRETPSPTPRVPTMRELLAAGDAARTVSTPPTGPRSRDDEDHAGHRDAA